MQRISRAIWSLALLGGLSLSGMAPQAVAGVPGENALPSRTVAFLKVADARELRDALSKSQIGLMIADPAMQPIKDDINAKLQDLNGEMKQRIGVTLAELLETPQGPAWLAVVPQEGEIPFGLILVADAGDNSDRMMEIMTKGTAQLEAQEGKASTESFKDLTLHIISPPDEKNPPLVWTNMGSTYVISAGLDVIKDVLANSDGREDSLAASESYNAIKKSVDGEAQVQWFIDLGQAVKMVTQQLAAGQGGDPGQIDAMVGLLGINQLKGVGGSIRLGEGPYDTQSTTFIYAPGEKQGLLRLFPMPLASMKPEPWVPDTVSSYQTISWDLDEAYVGLVDLINMFLPGALENVERGLQGPGGETIRFQQDVFGPLGDRVTAISDFKKPVTEDSQRTLIGIALEDTQGFQTTFNKILSIAGANPKKRDFQGVTIYDFELPEIPAQPGAPQMQFDGPVSVAIAKDTFFVTSDTTLLEQVLRAGFPTLADSPDFQAIARQFPEKLSSFSFNRSDEQARLAYNLLKSGQLSQAADAADVIGGGNVNVPDVDQLIDPEKLPEFSVFAKYLSDSGGYGVMTDQGLTIHQFTLKKTNP